MDLKRQCLTANNSNITEIAEEQTNNDGSFILFDGPTTEDMLSTTPPVVETMNISDDDGIEDEDKELIDEYDLFWVCFLSFLFFVFILQISKYRISSINLTLSAASTRQLDA